MQLFFNKNIDVNQPFFVFDKQESRHIIKVLRKKEQDLIFITNGCGYLITSKIIDANEKRCQVEVLSVKKQADDFDYYLHVAIAPTKNIDRLEWFIEKATEIGISEITPILCERSERKVVKTERLEKVLVSAMKQSLKYTLPKLNPLTPLKNVLQKSSINNKYIAHCMEDKKDSFKHYLLSEYTKNKKLELLVIIGPEGDFSPNEVELAIKKGFKPVSLGKSRLRTETAGIAATHSVAFTCE